jgi:hypothetical protein
MSRLESSIFLHGLRALVTAAISIGTFLLMRLAIDTWPVLQWAILLTIPIAVLAGLVPIIWWYRRDAYPIGLMFCPLMFFVLLWVDEWAAGIIDS